MGPYAFLLRQTETDVLFHLLPNAAPGAAPAAAPEAEAALREYLTLSVALEPLHSAFSAADRRFSALAPFLRGARMLRQDPVECLFSFICSSNNNISRIRGMVERLASAFGTRLEPPAGGASQRQFFAFPSLEQLAAADEAALRGMGFGYRAKFVTGTAATLAAKPGGGAAWLASLRGVPRAQAVAALAELPGVGPKVAACVALFSLDKHDCIPVDTHVWHLALQHYTPGLTGRTLTPRLMAEVEAAIQGVFGAYAGWAHNALFIAELPSHRCACAAAPGLAAAGRGRS